MDKMRNRRKRWTRSGDNIILNMPNNMRFDGSSNAETSRCNTITGVSDGAKENNKTCRERDWLAPTAPAAGI